MVKQEQLIQMGFKFGNSGAHSARTMMLRELKELFAACPESTLEASYSENIIKWNVLHKSTENSRKLTFRHLRALYGLNPEMALFRVFRSLWDITDAAQPVLALQLAVVRDPILRASVQLITSLNSGEQLNRDDIESCLTENDSDRYSQSSVQSFARNMSSTWTQAGYLAGRSKKHRSNPKITYVNVAYALFLAHCQGISGKRMFESEWCKLLDKDEHELYELAHAASSRGLIKFKHASEIIEVTFPNFKIEEQG